MIPPSTTITEEGRRTRRILLWLGVLIVGLNLLLWVIGRFSAEGGVTGPVGSSYVTTRSGAAALEGSLRRLGIPTEQLRSPLDEVTLDPDGSLVFSDVGAAEYNSSELNAVDAFLRGGGRVVVAGSADMVDRLIDDAPTWRAAGRGQATVVGDLLDPAPADPVRLSEFGSLEIDDGDEPFLVAQDGTVIGASRDVGDGTFVWLADSYPLHNEGLADAAATVVAVLDPFGPVMFDEYRHGYADSGGVWTIIPDRWRLALILGGVAALVALIGYGRRFGPPYDLQRRLPPGREAYLEAVAGILARSGDRREALELIRGEARRRLEERSGEADIAAGARAASLAPEEIQAILDDDDSDETLMAADRALATLMREKR